MFLFKHVELSYQSSELLCLTGVIHSAERPHVSHESDHDILESSTMLSISQMPLMGLNQRTVLSCIHREERGSHSNVLMIIQMMTPVSNQKTGKEFA